jgi:hypothetical protein
MEFAIDNREPVPQTAPVFPPANLMRKILVCVFCAFMLGSGSMARGAERFSAVVVFVEAGFPAADTAAPSPQQLQTLLPGGRIASAEQLPASLKDPNSRLLVLPYGSAFPEAAWPDIYAFLQRGGNLLVLGGRPFTRSAYRDTSGWKLRDYSVRFTRPLMIDQYQVTPGSDGLKFQTNPELTLKLHGWQWRRAFSPIIRLSAVDLYKRGGAAGSIDARLDALAWGVKEGRKLAAPAVQIDHLRNGFDGGRWIFLNSDLTPDSYGDTAEMIRDLAGAALRGSEEFSVRPVLPLYLPGEPVQLDVIWLAAQPASAPLTVRIKTFPADQPSQSSVVTSTVSSSPILPPPGSKGLHVVEAELLEGDQVRAIYHSGFWIRDEEYLRSGPRLAVNQDYFELDGHPLAVVGTTYMSSEVQRLYFEHPNAYVWERDLAQIHDAGLNIIRSGWWTGWDKFCDENGQPYDRTLRTIEAFLMTARRNGLPVQFNFFAFLPDVLGGVNPYLDPQAIRKQRTLISAVVARFHDVPWLAWDFINEPSISQYLWRTRPNGDPIELQAWNDWLRKSYPDRAALAAAWNVPAATLSGTVPVPEEIEFTPRGMYVGRNSLKVYDFFLFAQDVFDTWVQTMRDAVRSVGSQQLITVGQDEGGIQDRLSPTFWGKFVSFTTNHSWWENDYVLWDSLLAKQPGQAMLIQETGLQRELNLNETARRTPENEAALLERKIATSFVQGSGAIEWLWNTNSDMTESNETPIGAILPDATEKPEATILRGYGAFSKSLSSHLRGPVTPSIAIVTSQAAQFSVIGDLQLEAQRTAVRALAYDDRLTLYAVAENQIAEHQVEKLGSPRLAILPSPQALTETAWRALLKYVNEGGNLLITGPVDHDEHWQSVMRAADLKLQTQVEPITYRNATIQLPAVPLARVQSKDGAVTMSFDQQKQSWLDSLRFSDGSTFKEVSYGKGRIFWASYPAELAEGTKPAADLYTYVAGRLGITPMFELQSPLAPGVLIYPIELQDSVLYIMVSDSADNIKVDLRDRLTGVQVTLPLASQHAALAVIGKREKSVVAKYGFPD